jgi:IclR family transcriptional regulator, acetate operon repressor
MGPITLALAVIRELTAEPYGLTLQDLTARLRRSASTLHRVLRDLEDQQLVVRSTPGHGYLLGPATIELADRIAATTDTIAGTRLGRILARAAARTGETVFVARRSESGPAVVVAAAPSPHPLRVCIPVGTTLRLAATTTGRVLLAWQEPAQIVTALAATPPAPGPIAMNDLFDHLGTVRDRGYDTGTDEIDTDTWTVTAPIRPTATVTGALTIAVPSPRATRPRRSHTTAAALDTADVLNAQPLDRAQRLSAPGP